MNTLATQWPNILSEQKRNIVIQLIYANTESNDEREEWLDHLESASDEQDADDIIKSLSNNNDL